MKLLAQKTALITGATRGIGLAMAKKFAEQGANIAFTYMNSEEKANTLVTELNAYGIKSKAYKSDASSFEAAALLIEEVVKEFGTIDVLINNAGITRDNLMLRMSEEQWDEVIDNNLKSVFNMTKNACKTFLKQNPSHSAQRWRGHPHCNRPTARILPSTDCIRAQLLHQ